MAFDPPPDVVFAAVSAGVLTLFALAVGWIGKFRGAPLWFMMFEAGFGLTALVSNIQEGFEGRAADPASRPDWLLYGLALPQLVTVGVALAGLALLVHGFPVPATAPERRRRIWSAVPILAIVAIVGWIAADHIRQAGEMTVWQGIAAVMDDCVFPALAAAMWGAVLFLAFRYRACKEPRERTQMSLVAAAIGLYPGMWLTWNAMDNALAGDYPSGFLFWLAVIIPVVLAAVWLAATRTPASKGARNVALVLLAAPVVGVLIAALWPHFSPSGIARTMAILILAFAVLRHQIMGIDVKVRWAISKSSLAAIFIAVFFVGSETAQQFFGERLGGPYFGIAAAGALVFVLAPLSKMADRIAERAVPVASVAGVAVTSGVVHSSRKHDVYRDALSVALRDRRVTREEEIKLARLAHELGIGAGEAVEMLHQAELSLVARGKGRPKARGGNE